MRLCSTTQSPLTLDIFASYASGYVLSSQVVSASTTGVTLVHMQFIWSFARPGCQASHDWYCIRRLFAWHRIMMIGIRHRERWRNAFRIYDVPRLS